MEGRTVDYTSETIEGTLVCSTEMGDRGQVSVKPAESRKTLRVGGRAY